MLFHILDLAWLILLEALINKVFAAPILKISPNNCSAEEYFDISQLDCRPCGSNSLHSDDGFSCVCKPGFRIVAYGGSGNISCATCAPDQVTTKDGWDCVACDFMSKRACTCKPDEFTNYRTLSGALQPKLTCEKCEKNMTPSSSGDRCVPCNPAVAGINCICSPPSQTVGGVCVKPENLAPDLASLSQITFENRDKLQSSFFTENLRAADAMCKVNKNLTACQLLGNLCVLLHYSRDQSQENACSLFSKIASSQVGGQTVEWPQSMPWLFYLNNEANFILYRQEIPTYFTFDETSKDSSLRLTLAKYDVKGVFLGLSKATEGSLQLCKTSHNVLEAAFKFGYKYKQKCKLTMTDLLNHCSSGKGTVFYDIYLDYDEAGKTLLYPVPILNQNLMSGSVKVNKLPSSDSNRWQLVRRLFLVDCISGQDLAPTTMLQPPPKVIRYAKYVGITIELQPSRDGRIYPPLVTVEYGEAKAEDLFSGSSVETVFEMNYKMNTQRYEKDIEITMGVLCSFGALWACLRTWFWYQRSGRVNQLDHITLLNLLFYLASSISNVFFVVVLGMSLWMLVFYKKQKAVTMMILTPENEYSFLVYVGLATALKQISAHVFFIDWERPRGYVIPNRAESSENSADEKTQQVPAPVNIWRTYMVANEWNELQCHRKTHCVLQLILMLFFLKFLNFEALALVQPDAMLYDVPTEFQDTRLTRFAVAAALYLIIGFTQWFVSVAIIERCITDPFHCFADLCSISNVSVLIMHHCRYGYYIHGRSVHGYADTNMREMNMFLQREREDLCSKRGLEPNSDQQFFTVLLPLNFRTHYDNLLSGITLSPQQTRMTAADPATVKTESVIQVYEHMNSYLCSFIEHTLPDVDYTVKHKTFFECVLDMELQEMPPINDAKRGVFYIDSTDQAFASVLFYGNEFALLTFDLLIFCIVDLIAHDFVLAAVIAYLTISAVRMFRSVGGTRNIVKRSLVDQRFLM